MIPKNLLYQNKKSSAYARNYSSYIQPQNGSGDYTDGQTIIINIPTSQNLVMAGSESVLKFDLTVTNGAGANAYARLDRAGAHGVIQRLRLYHGSQLLEDLDNYGNIVANLMSLQQSGDAAKGKMNVLAGLNNESFCEVGDGSAVDLATALVILQAADNKVTTLNSGERFIDDGQTSQFADIAAAGDTLTRTYCINLLSIVGSLSDKYIPLFAMTSAPLRLELQLASSPAKFICSELALASYKINNCEFVGQFMELGGEAMNIINNSIGGGKLEWVVPAWRNYVYNATLANSTYQVSVPVPAKFNSLKSLFMTQRSNADGALTLFPFGSCHYNLDSYTVRLGSKVVPSKAPNTVPEFFLECLKAIGSVSDINHEPNMDLKDYDVDVPVVNAETEAFLSSTATSEAFLVGMDLETYSNADKDSIYSGYNTSNDDIFWHLTFGANATTPSVRFDSYALYDTVITCEAGVAYTQY
jgi:hypothetical protein